LSPVCPCTLIGCSRIGIGRTADQEIATAAETDGRVGADTAIIAGEIATADVAARRIHRPGKLRRFGEAEIDADPAHVAT